MWHTTGNLTAVKDNAKFPFGVAMLPASKQRGSPTGGGNWYIFKKSTPAERKAAFEFIKWVTAPERAAEWSIATGYVAVSPAAYETPKLKTYVSEFPQAAVARDQLKFATPELSTFQTGRVRKALDDAIQAAITGSKSPAEALKARRRNRKDCSSRTSRCDLAADKGTATFCERGLIRENVRLGSLPFRGAMMRHVYGWLLLTPAAILLIAFTHYPAFATLVESFFSTGTAVRPSRFVGIDNYESLLGDPVFWQVLRNNFWFALGTIPTSIALALLMAIWVNARLPARALVRMAYFTPTVLPMIAVANLWLYFYTPQIGLLDKVAALFGAGSHNWLGNPDTVMGCLVAMTIWKEAGFFMIFYLAALQSLPPELEEAAAHRGRVALVLLPARDLSAAHADDAVRAGERDHQLVQARRPSLHPDQGRPGQRLQPAALLHLPGGVQLLRRGVRGDADRGLARPARGLRGRAIPAHRAPGALPMISNVEKAAAWILAVLWLSPLLYAFWAAFHPPAYATVFDPLAPLTLANFEKAWGYAPFPRHFLNTVILVTMVLAAQLVLCTLAAFAFARFDFAGRDIAFALVLVQLMIMPEVLIVENYRTMARLGLVDTILGIGLPYMASAFGIFLLRQTFKTIPRELEEAARVEGCSWLGVLWRVYVPLARPTYLAYALVSVSYHWNNFLWPLIVTNSVSTRPLTVGLAIFGAPESGVDWSVISAGTLMAVAPLLVAFLLFQRQFMQSFMQAGIK